MERELSFEEALNEIEQILKQLENKNLDLEKAIELYERGMFLIRFCEEKLKKARAKVEVILKDEKGFNLETLERASEILKDGN
ncbi:exodeoxyribonuclease VII small subunit [Thermodesulfobacterium sp. TA1]|uniref:exodeoxyribonuclease VII small subunit n=1 Tax=Thermodesulfobacterium sp. TA1 TaxID=2234087 RepID=UPI0012323DAF|nr:exodeoxyribonuclease VII small subunit [Thermodesulfobacterium sp. TA1]QER41724.1 exodeoxyribonuclease VII small subunit [Thermodesulfobacterium sp. TA1]